VVRKHPHALFFCLFPSFTLVSRPATRCFSDSNIVVLPSRARAFVMSISRHEGFQWDFDEFAWHPDIFIDNSCLVVEVQVHVGANLDWLIRTFRPHGTEPVDREKRRLPMTVPQHCVCIAYGSVPCLLRGRSGKD